ncbi:MAG: DinB family protein [Chitinophagaceae bacterium]
MNQRPFYQDAPSYCHPFFDLVTTDDLIKELNNSLTETSVLFSSIPPEKAEYRYAADKWSVKEVLQHLVDCERVYSYRAFRFSRFDASELAGFEENDYIKNVERINRSMDDLCAEFIHLRNATIHLYSYMTEEMLDFKGKANNVIYTARSLGFMTVGHSIHHCNMIRSHYLSN